MPYYTPSPMVNFQFDPNPSDAQRIVDTTNKIKKQREESDLNALKMQSAQMEMQQAAMNLRAGEIKAQEAAKAQELDTLSGQTYNGTLAATGSKVEALRATKALRAQIGGWGVKQKDEANEQAQIKEAMEGKAMTPQIASHIADLINSNDPTGTSKASGADIERQYYQSQAKVTAEGEVTTWNPTTNQFDTIQSVSPEKRKEQEGEAALKVTKEANDKAYRDAQIGIDKARLGLEQQRIGQNERHFQITAAQQASNAIAKKEAAADKLTNAKASAKLTPDDKVYAKEIESDTRLIKSINRSIANGKPEDILETAMRARGMATGPGWEEKLQALADETARKRNIAIKKLAESPTGKRVAIAYDNSYETGLGITLDEDQVPAQIDLATQEPPRLPPPLPSILPSRLSQNATSDLPVAPAPWNKPNMSPSEAVVASGAVNMFRKKGK